MGDLSEHFSRREFACRCGCGLDIVDRKLVRVLESARRLMGRPVIITSGCRCEQHNATLATASADSAHLYGLAADVWCPTATDRYALLCSLLTAGAERVGVYARWIHLDCDRSKPLDVCWLG